MLAHIIHQRMDEIFNLVLSEIERAGFAQRLNGGVVITGGAAAMQGVGELAADVFGTGVRIGSPTRTSAASRDSVDAPRFATVVGLALYGAHRPPPASRRRASTGRSRAPASTGSRSGSRPGSRISSSRQFVAGSPPLISSRVLDLRRSVGRGYPLRRYARLVGAPNYAPSLRSVAGLLHALALQSACEDTRTLLPTDVGTRATARARSTRQLRITPSLHALTARARCARGASAPSDREVHRAQASFTSIQGPRLICRGASGTCCYETVQGGEGVLVGAFQSEREETRDRAERGSAVQGLRPSERSAEAGHPRRPRAEMPAAGASHAASYEKIIKLLAKKRVWITRLTPVVVFLG